MKARVIITLDSGEEIEGEIADDHGCFTGVYQAIGYGKDPVRALAWLAEMGFKALNWTTQFKAENHEIAQRNHLGSL